MHYRIIVAVLMLTVTPYTQGAPLKGVILANELGGTPVPNVQISAIVDANPTTSLSDGTFTLQFPRKQPGRSFNLSLRKRAT